MTGKKFGYVRVSSKEQNEARQLQALKEKGINERDIFIDKVSGKNFEREQYQLLKRMLRKGDVLYIHSLDRFGRNYEEIVSEWNELTKQIQADIIVLDMPLLDTTNKQVEGVGVLISNIVLQLLSWVAEEERSKIKTRQKEGIAAAKKEGKHLGRPKAEMPPEFEGIYTEWKAGDITAKTAMERLELKRTTFYKLVGEYEGRAEN